MFNSNHYVPVLRWKGAERLALKNLKQEDKQSVTPLLEILPPPPVLKGERKTLDDVIPKVSTDIFNFWGQDPIFLDIWLIEEAQQSACINKILSSSKNHDLQIIPVMHLDST